MDFAERQRQQIIEQRKFPILRASIDNPTTFHYVISPRQHVEQRGFKIPFLMSDYSLERRLESVPYETSAFIVSTCPIPKITMKIEACYKDYGNPQSQCMDNIIKPTFKNDDSEKTIDSP